MDKRRIGRPRKLDNRIEFWRFVRGAVSMAIYDEVRRGREKHSAALAEVVAFVRKRFPGMPISESEVKRILAAWRPRGCNEIFSFERFSPSAKDIERRRQMLEQVHMLDGDKGSSLPISPKGQHPQNATTFKIRISKRPDYPRHNAKVPPE